MTTLHDNDATPAPGVGSDLRTAATHTLTGPPRPAGERHAYRPGQFKTLCGLRLGYDVFVFTDIYWGQSTPDTVACLACANRSNASM